MNHFYDQEHMGENWFSYAPFYAAMVKRFPSGSHFVEVGSWKGKSASHMAVEIINSGKQIQFDCVDTWDDAYIYEAFRGQNIYECFVNNMEPVKHVINMIRKESVVAAQDYADGSLDFVFIDASHDRDSVISDINAWLPKVKSGGVLAGHDYGAVRDYTMEVLGIDANSPYGCDCWQYEKI